MLYLVITSTARYMTNDGCDGGWGGWSRDKTRVLCAINFSACRTQICIKFCLKLVHAALDVELKNHQLWFTANGEKELSRKRLTTPPQAKPPPYLTLLTPPGRTGLRQAFIPTCVLAVFVIENIGVYHNILFIYLFI